MRQYVSMSSHMNKSRIIKSVWCVLLKKKGLYCIYYTQTQQRDWGWCVREKETHFRFGCKFRDGNSWCFRTHFQLTSLSTNSISIVTERCHNIRLSPFSVTHPPSFLKWGHLQHPTIHPSMSLRQILLSTFHPPSLLFDSHWVCSQEGILSLIKVAWGSLWMVLYERIHL